MFSANAAATASSFFSRQRLAALMNAHGFLLDGVSIIFFSFSFEIELTFLILSLPCSLSPSIVGRNLCPSNNLMPRR
jgi:hypothetical protein